MSEWIIKSTMEMNKVSRFDLLKSINKSNTITLNNNVLNSINTNEEYYIQHLNYHNMHFRNGFHLHSGKEHYRLLIYMSLHFNGCNIFEIGTCGGVSSLALSSNPSNQIHTFDIVNVRSPELTDINNIHFYIEDIMEHPEHHEKMLSSPFIFYDTTHDGPLEKQFYDFLMNNNYKGILLLDDIYYTDGIKMFWNNIQTPKIDITKYGHETGTGVVMFNNEINFKLE